MSGQNASKAEILADCMRELGWSPRELARRLGVNESTTRNWISGRREPPDNVIDWLQARARAVGSLTLPELPEGWSPGRGGDDGDGDDG
jgi:transcriptional regulator with XRE-family HTH domain